MKVNSTTFNKSINRIKRDLFGNGFPRMYTGGEPPMRSELLSADQMEEHGRNLADSHTLQSQYILNQHLLTRLSENEEVLIEVRDLIIDAIKANRQNTPAAEWLLDNFYLIEEHIQIGKRHLPKAYSRELPRLASGPSKGLPRVYDIALEIISHGDGRVDPENLIRFVAAYQTVDVLTLGELWAIPIMLRLALIENLRRVAVLVAEGRLDRNLADTWADKMMQTATNDPKNLILIIADMARSNPVLTPSFVSEFVRRLQGQSPALALSLTWIEQQLSETGLTIERLVQLGNQQLASDQISISNSIGSLRFLGAMDWQEFVETMSAVEQTLRKDPEGSYPKMDFATRDHYRHVIEKIAKKSPLSEEEVAKRAIKLAKQTSETQGASHRTSHVGYYLIDKGLPLLEKTAEVQGSIQKTLTKFVKRFKLLLYTGSILLLTKILTSGLLAYVYKGGIHAGLLIFLVIIIFISTVHLAVALVNWLATLLVTPTPMPRMDFSKGIPAESRSMVVIPTMLTSNHNTEELIEALEVRFLANRDKNLHFALLTDFRDAESEKLPDDDILLNLAVEKINSLNLKYPEKDSDVFLLFHRPRRWNPGERLWMGYERKRGKLSDLNSLLSGSREDNFSLVIGKSEVLSEIKFVITLDTDTQLPRDSARQFVGTMAHPLNRAIYNEKKQRVSEGYGIMQPRVGVSLPGTTLSRYSKLYGSEPGIDPYTRVVSDVYQDVFSEGSFIGKGIYDVEIFGRVFNNRFPENRILSHDLLEGCYARAGLLSDVQLFEEYPANYFADVNRRHRWIRGDWQIVKWLLPFIKGPDGKLQRNPLSALSKWKIFDNLRRSITPLALTVLLILGWTALSQPVFWTMVVVGIIMGPSVVISVLDIFNKPTDVIPIQHLKSSMQAAGIHFAQSAFMFVCLPYEAIYSLDAILRTIWRILISHKRLLEWNPSGSHDNGDSKTIYRSYKTMWMAPFFAFVTLISLALWWPLALVFVWPIPFLWIASPAIVWWVSKVPIRREALLTDNQKLFLREVACKTWAFFETFVSSEENWLPPDNFQEQPVKVVAHRTSPTNMGLSLLANLSAYDFGYIHAGHLIQRTSNSIRTMESMERFRGHFYNWYDTQSLKPLQPLYISSVDSGNLVGHLMILRSGLLSLHDKKIFGLQVFDAINDTRRILLGVTKGNFSTHLDQFRNDLTSVLNIQQITLQDIWSHVNKLVTSATLILNDYKDDPDSESCWWAGTMARQCQNALDDLTYLAPWLQLADSTTAVTNFQLIDEIPTLRELATIDTRILPRINEWLSKGNNSKENIAYFDKIRHSITDAVIHANERLAEIDLLLEKTRNLTSIDYDFLYDKGRHLLSVGYSVAERIRDASYYDLLASEARFSTFVAIAQGKISQESWFALGRLITVTGGDPVLLSWSGSMFEYLMPLLVMPNYDDTLLDQTYKSAVNRQIQYGKLRGIPWGISESGYNLVDVHLNYQYKAFGVPGMGLKRGLAEDLVIAPYASMLALMVVPEEACLNLERLAAQKVTGKFGFYEAVDYTKSRLNQSQSGALVQSFMAHHQGMGLLSLAYVILDKPMQKLFESDPLFQATLLLLQERIPKTTAFYSYIDESSDIHAYSEIQEMPVRIITTPNTAIPEVHLLSNGNYHVMVTNSGSGYSRWKDLAVTRWREDTTSDNWGMFCYIRDTDSGEFWSTAYQPTLKQPDNYEAIFSKGRAEFRRHDNDLDTHMEVVVSPEDDIELRRVRITNRSRSRKTIDITSYAEVVIASSAADSIHPAFGNLFVQTEIVDQRQTILCSRRPRSNDDKTFWMFHLMTMHGAKFKEVSYETDRMKFIGRGNTIIDPQAMKNQGPLSGSEGSVLDPIVSIRYLIVLNPEESAKIDMVSGITETREAALSLVDKYQDRRLANRIFELAWTYSQIILRQINASEADAQLYGRLASSIIYANSSLRADQNILMRNRRGQSGLWGYSISGDLPIVLLQIENPSNITLVRQLVQAHAYWRLKGLAVDLVIWNEDHAGYRQLLHDQIMGLIAAGLEANTMDRPGGIFVRAADQISNEDRILIQTVARAIITDKRGSLAEQINHKIQPRVPIALFKPSRTYRPFKKVEEELQHKDLIFFNGIGGFAPDGSEYVISTSDSQETPAPWVNVLANPDFGTVISEKGSSYTWSENAHEIRLTPWNNDPVSDVCGEAIFIRDEETGHFWSPMPLQFSGTHPYISRHGFGYSVFEHAEDGILSELWIYVAIDAPIKISVLKLINLSGRPRRLSVTGYVEWVLGDLRPKSVMHVITAIDPGSGAIFARNPYNTEFGERIAFFHADDSQNLTCDRTEFLGRNGTLRDPAAMYLSRLSGRVGAGMDPCSAIQVSVELAVGQGRETIFRLGAGRNATEAGRLVRRFWGSMAPQSALEEVRKFWKNTLNTIQIETPDKSINVLINGWLMYQTLACRIWARSGFYQSGGAFGFRDQLQDVMALLHVSPYHVRQHLLLCASRQFKEGDVQHWWHPPVGRGVRTHCSDDFLWLPLVTCKYVIQTGDTGVLDESVHFLEGQPVKPTEDSYFDLPNNSDEEASLYQHCVRAIQRGLNYGKHGLPLMGTGDWNDGMNLVGNEGKGESVWLGFFLYDVLTQFSKVAKIYGDISFTEKCQKEAVLLQKNIEKNSWDGEWYLRAWFDNGTPLGSSINTECQIDSIAQSWSVLSGAGEPIHSQKAMESLEKRLVRRNPPLIQLLDPPFDKSDLNPGYIKGYVPGVRENGGQYTHAAIWAAMAFAKSGDVKHAWELLSIINPINHGTTMDEIATYKAEPYVVAADVYAVSPHSGRGGWTWYTGSAGLLYRLIIESLLGIRREVNKLYIESCIPSDWTTYNVHYRYNETMYNITIMISHENSITLDGSKSPERFLTLVNDQKEHQVIWNILQVKFLDANTIYSELRK